MPTCVSSLHARCTTTGVLRIVHGADKTRLRIAESCPLLRHEKKTLKNFKKKTTPLQQMSNIANVFNPPPGRDLSDEECLGCTAVQLAVCLGGGSYFLSSMPFKDKTGLVDLRRHPVWFQRGIRATGIGLLALACYRLGEVAKIYHNRKD